MKNETIQPLRSRTMKIILFKKSKCALAVETLKNMKVEVIDRYTVLKWEANGEEDETLVGTENQFNDFIQFLVGESTIWEGYEE